MSFLLNFLHFCLIVGLYICLLHCVLLFMCLSCVVLFGLMTTRLNKYYCYYYYYYHYYMS